MAFFENIKRHIEQLSVSSLEASGGQAALAIQDALPYPQTHSFSRYSPSVESFEDTYKTAYSHGLEAIYTLENVDLKTVKRIEQKPRLIPDETTSSKFKNPLPYPQQLEFDLGPEYHEWIESFILREPIHVLGLSKHAEKRLLEQGKRTLQALVEANIQDFAFIKGMGQGHVDEIQHKLQNYLAGHTLHRCVIVDFASWIRCLTASLDRKKAFVCLQPYNLHELFSLSPSESVEVGRLTLEKRQEWIEEIRMQLRWESQRQSVSCDMCQIADVFMKPWMQRRLGLACQHELQERLQRISENASLAQNAQNFLSSVYFGDRFPLADYLHPVEPELYCADAKTANDYLDIVKVAYSYFYKPHISYTLSQLVMLLEREFALAWRGFRDGFMERVLRLSPHFRVRKGAKGTLEIRLA